ncbi:MAG TPA: nucleoside deaminase [Terrimicrobiaceae bacterium]|nr:nucleoside deaminase [Terrimicrobiaceae bacterium]
MMMRSSIRFVRAAAVVLGAAVFCPLLAEEKSPPPSPEAQDSGGYQEAFMKRAIEIARTALTKPGTEPFGAVIVRNGEIVGEGLSQALTALDVTSHGEIEAIRDANRRLKRLDLSDCEIYTTCEPCPLCVAAIGIARLKKMYYAASLDQAGVAFAVLPPNGRFPVDVDQLIADERTTVGERQLPAEQKLDVESFEVLQAWALERKAALAK